MTSGVQEYVSSTPLRPKSDPQAFTLTLAAMGIPKEVFFAEPMLMKSILQYHFLLDEMIETSDMTDGRIVVQAK